MLWLDGVETLRATFLTNVFFFGWFKGSKLKKNEFFPKSSNFMNFGKNSIIVCRKILQQC